MERDEVLKLIMIHLYIEVNIMGGIFNHQFDNRKPRKHAGRSFSLSKEVDDILPGNDIILPTVLRVTSEEIDYWTNMTCFYDKYWEFNPAFSTVPISFMHITSVTEIIQAQGAEKRVIVYEAPETLGGTTGLHTANQGYKNNLEVIMDNVVVHPKQYQMEVIIPDSLIGPFHKQGLARLEALIDYMSLTGTEPEYIKKSGNNLKRESLDIDEFTEKIGDALRIAQVFIDTVDTAAGLADLILGSTQAGSSQMATINKNSVEAMASKGRVVLFKKWTGYDYCYGIITKIDIAKKPTEDGVYRGSITFQEAPILNISRKKTSAMSSISSVRATATSIARYVNLGLSLPFLKMTGVMDEAGPVGSDTAGEHSIRDTLGGLF